MAVSPGLSCVLSASISLVVMAGMQIFRGLLISSKLNTLFAGYLGSLIFILILTSISNLEMSLFGKHFQSKYTEVIISLLTAMFTAGLVHQVAVTTCLIFSLIWLYFLNRISVRTYQTNIPVQTQATAKNVNTRKKK